MNKQINNFAKIIPVDNQGNPLTTPSEYKIKEIKKDKSPRMTFILVIILIIIAVIAAFISFCLLPIMN